MSPNIFQYEIGVGATAAIIRLPWHRPMPLCQFSPCRDNDEAPLRSGALASAVCPPAFMTSTSFKRAVSWPSQLSTMCVIFTSALGNSLLDVLVPPPLMSRWSAELRETREPRHP